MNWEQLSGADKINILSNASTVEHNLLLDCEPLIAAIKSGKSQAECLEIINANF